MDELHHLINCELHLALHALGVHLEAPHRREQADLNLPPTGVLDDDVDVAILVWLLDCRVYGEPAQCVQTFIV